MARATQPAAGRGGERSEGNGNGNGRQPKYIARAKQSPESDFMVTIGAAWPFKEGDGLVVKLQLVPTRWDGDFILVTPKDGD